MYASHNRSVLYAELTALVRSVSFNFQYEVKKINSELMQPIQL